MYQITVIMVGAAIKAMNFHCRPSTSQPFQLRFGSLAVRWFNHKENFTNKAPFSKTSNWLFTQLFILSSFLFRIPSCLNSFMPVSIFCIPSLILRLFWGFSYFSKLVMIAQNYFVHFTAYDSICLRTLGVCFWDWSNLPEQVFQIWTLALGVGNYK